MSKPEWKDAPEWANYLAMDSDGAWFWYEVEPKPSKGCWVMRLPTGCMQATSHLPNYKETLERRP